MKHIAAELWYTHPSICSTVPGPREHRELPWKCHKVDTQSGPQLGNSKLLHVSNGVNIDHIIYQRPTRTSTIYAGIVSLNINRLLLSVTFELNSGGSHFCGCVLKFAATKFSLEFEAQSQVPPNTLYSCSLGPLDDPWELSVPGSASMGTSASVCSISSSLSSTSSTPDHQLPPRRYSLLPQNLTYPPQNLERRPLWTP